MKKLKPGETFTGQSEDVPFPYPSEEKIFNEESLRREIIKIWGEYGAHYEVYKSLLNRVRKELTNK